MRIAELAVVVAVLVVGGLSACEPGSGSEVGGSDSDGLAVASEPSVVDSIRTVAEELRLFRSTLPHHPDRLTGGASSLDGLVETLVAAVNAGDASAAAALAVTRSEFAYFHYPHSPYAKPPYELSPALVWYRLTSSSARGMTRLFATFDDRTLNVGEITCAEPAEAGSARIHECSVGVLDASDAWVDVRLFGPILERDGSYKLLSFANDL